MNLVSDPWVPVLDAKNQTRLVGLEELFRDSNTLADLALKPLERVAVTRLLICVTQAALDGPSDRADWEACREKIVPVSLAYLGKWKHRFELYGPDPFLQVTTLEDTCDTSVDDRFGFGPSAAVSPIFNHGALTGDRLRDPAWVALHLVTHQCFALMGLIGHPKWAGRVTLKGKRNSANPAPCAEGFMLLLLLQGATLLDTIHVNMVPKSDLGGLTWGRPIWEQYPSGPESTDDTYLGRLVPLARAIKLYPGKAWMSYGKGLRYSNLPTFRESMATVVLRDKGGKEFYQYVKTDPEKHPWRELGSILTLGKADKADSGPRCLIKFRGQLGGLDVWVGGMSGKQGKLKDITEWNCHLPPEFISEGALPLYTRGVRAAEAAKGRVVSAIKMYGKKLCVQDTAGLQRRALTHFWTRLDNRAVELAMLANVRQGLDSWDKLVQDTAHESYAVACPRTTPRELEAFVAGEKGLEKKGGRGDR